MLVTYHQNKWIDDSEQTHPFPFSPWHFIWNAFYLIELNFCLCQFLDDIDVFGLVHCVKIFSSFSSCRCRLLCELFVKCPDLFIMNSNEKKTGRCYSLVCTVHSFHFLSFFHKHQICTCEFLKCHLLSMV